MRTRFCKLLSEQINEIMEQKDRLIFDFSKKDDDGNPLYESLPGNKVKYHLTDTASFNYELDILMKEEFVIEENEINKDMLETVADVLLNLSIPLKGQEALMYERYCEAFENLKF